MGKNCLEEYLTDSCQNCEFWRNDEIACGCCCPFPIMHCEAFAKMYNEAEKELSEMRKEDEGK